MAETDNRRKKVNHSTSPFSNSQIKFQLAFKVWSIILPKYNFEIAKDNQPAYEWLSEAHFFQTRAMPALLQLKISASGS